MHRLLLASCTLAVKLHDDKTHRNWLFAKVGGVTAKELCSLEGELGRRLDWNLFIDGSKFTDMVHKLVACGQHMHKCVWTMRRYMQCEARFQPCELCPSLCPLRISRPFMVVLPRNQSSSPAHQQLLQQQHQQQPEQKKRLEMEMETDASLDGGGCCAIAAQPETGHVAVFDFKCPTIFPPIDGSCSVR
jgi:hypothetical protein